MATTNQNYADLLTLRFYSSLYSPPLVKPLNIPGITTYTKLPVNKQAQPTSCNGRCIQTKLSTIDISIDFSEESFGGINTSLGEYKRCLNAVVSSSITEEETSECFTIDDFERISSQLKLNETPYRAFELIPTQELGILKFKARSLILHDAGVCDHCLLKNKVCQAIKNRQYNQTHKVCQNRIGYATETPGPDFPEVSPEIPEYRFKGHRTSWVFREVLNGLVNAGSLQFETNCACEEINPLKPSSPPALSEPIPTAASGVATSSVGSGTQPTPPSSQTEYDSSNVPPPPPPSPVVPTPPSSGGSSTSRMGGGGYGGGY